MFGLVWAAPYSTTWPEARPILSVSGAYRQLASIRIPSSITRTSTGFSAVFRGSGSRWAIARRRSRIAAANRIGVEQEIEPSDDFKAGFKAGVDALESAVFTELAATEEGDT
jgi:hypothetical protein